MPRLSKKKKEEIQSFDLETTIVTSPQQTSNFEEEGPTLNEELLTAFYSLKSNKAWLHIVKNIEHWKNQCLNEILKEKETDKQKGEFSAYGRVINAPDFFIQILTSNPGKGPELDPFPKK